MNDPGSLALVESADQLLDVVELARHADLAVGLGDLRIAVLAPSVGDGREQLRAVVALAREEGLALTWHEPRLGGASVSRTVRSLVDQVGHRRHLVVGDPLSGVLQALVAFLRPTEVTVIDPTTTQPWTQAARLGRLAPGRMARLRLFTCLPTARADLEAAGVEVHANTFGWLRRRWPAPQVLHGVELVGSPPVAAGLPDPGAYVDVRRLVEQEGVARYRAHPSEPAARLDRIRALGVEVVTSCLPLEVEVRKGPVGHIVIGSAPRTCCTLPLVLGDTEVRTMACPIPEARYPGAIGNTA